MQSRTRPGQSRKRPSVWIAAAPVIVSGACLVAFGIFVTVHYLNSIETDRKTTISYTSTVLENENISNDNSIKGDEEVKLSNITIIDRLNLQFRPSLTRPNQVEWPELLDRPVSSYPIYNSLLDIVAIWNPDDPDPPAVFKETLQHFNYSDPYERSMAERFRDAEIPFKVYNAPDIDEVVNKWTDQYLLSKLEMLPGGHVERSEDNHFMYWTMSGGRAHSNFVPPTTILKDLHFKKWLEFAHDADEKKIGPDVEHFYFMSNAAAHDKRTFIGQDLDVFSTTKENFFITNAAANKGIQCRFSMRGIIAEAHYDTGRNMVAMLKGAKRYILTPPSTCERLGIITDPSHPSYRHSDIDWSNLDEAKEKGFGTVPAIDTIVHEGEVLYIPSFWFHYIISLQYSIQCNSRSGTPPKHDGKRHIEECLGLHLDFSRYNGPKPITGLRGK